MKKNTSFVSFSVGLALAAALLLWLWWGASEPEVALETGTTPAAGRTSAAPMEEGRGSLTPSAEAPAQAVDDALATLYGTVTGEESQPVAGARLIAVPVHGHRGFLEELEERQWRSAQVETAWFSLHAREGLERGRHALTDDAGRYEVARLRPGCYRVVVQDGSHLGADATAALNASERRRVDFSLVPAGGVVGEVVDEAGQPVPGATVTAVRSEIAAARGRGSVFLLRHLAQRGDHSFLSERARTDDLGRFELTGLDHLPYHLTVVVAGYVEKTVRDVVPRPEVLRIALEAGGEITGTLEAEGGGGPSHARVAALRLGQSDDPHAAPGWSWEQWQAAHRGTVMPSAPGEAAFSIGGLSQGDYRVHVLLEGCAPFEADVLIAEQGESVDIGSIVLRRERPIRGRVLDETGAPLRGASVRALVLGEGKLHPRRLSVVVPVAVAESEDDGSFILSGLPRGEYDIEVWSREHAPALLTEVADGMEDLEVRLERGLVLNGRVMSAADGEPIPDARVFADPSQEATTDESGLFVLSGLTGEGGEARLAPGETVRVRLHASADDYCAAFPSVSASSTVSEETIEISLEPTLALSGIVRIPDGTPLAGAAVRLIVPGVPLEMAVLGQHPAATVSAPDGSFRLRIESLDVRGAATKPALIASYPGYAEARSGPLEEEALRAEAVPIELVLGHGTTVHGRVVDSGGSTAGVPYAKVSLRFTPPEQRAALVSEALGMKDFLRTTRSSDDGTFSLPNVPEGDYLLEAVRGGFAPESLPLSIASAEEEIEVDVLLQSESSISGTVTDLAGRPIERVEIVAGRLLDGVFERYRLDESFFDGPGVARASSDAEGRFHAGPVPASSPLVLLARREGFELGRVELRERDSDTVDFVLTPQIVFSGSVRGEDGVLESFSGRLTFLKTDAGFFHPGRAAMSPSPSWSDPWNRRGMQWSGSPKSRFRARGESFRMAGMPPGRYRFRVESEGFVPYEARVEFSPGDAKQVDVVLRRGALLRGSLVSAEGARAVDGAKLMLQSMDAPGDGLSILLAGESGVDGRFEFSGLPDGLYSLRATHPLYAASTVESLRVAGDLTLEPVSLLPAAVVNLELLDLPAASGRDGLRAVLEPVAAVATQGAKDAHRFRRLHTNRFRSKSVPPGEYFLVVDISGYSEFRYGILSVGPEPTEFRIAYQGRKQSE